MLTLGLGAAAVAGNPQRRRAPNFGFVSSMSLLLRGQDTFFGGAGQPPPNRIWPTRPAPRRVITNRSHIELAAPIRLLPPGTGQLAVTLDDVTLSAAVTVDGWAFAETPATGVWTTGRPT